jgi:hypothetical protein
MLADILLTFPTKGFEMDNEMARKPYERTETGYKMIQDLEW